MKRAAWNVVQGTVFRCTTKRFGQRFRIWLLRLFGAKIGERCLIAPTVLTLQPWELEIGDQVAVAEGVRFYNFTKIRVGSNTTISQRCFLCTGSHDYTKIDFPLIYAPIEVGESAWIASEAFVSPGVKIGDGTVIAARSVVTKDMPAWMVCGGYPCKPLKERILETK